MVNIEGFRVTLFKSTNVRIIIILLKVCFILRKKVELMTTISKLLKGIAE